MSRKSLLKNCLLLFLILLANTAVMAQIPTEGLIGYWPFNGNANDASGNNNNGILEGESQNPQLATDRFGTENAAYEFGGYYNKNWIRVPNNSSMQLGSQMSISFWYQQCEFSGMDGWGNYSTTNATFSLFSKAGDGIAAYPGIYIYNGINSQTGNVNIYSANCNGSATYYQNYGISTEYRCFDPCEWMHYVTVIDDNVAKIYINGILYSISNINHANFTQANLQDMYLGRMGCSGTIWYPFHGKMDDIAFYNRALTEAEVAQLFDNYYDPHYFDNQIIIENLIVQKACNGNDGSVQVFVNPENGPYQYALDQPTDYQDSNLLENITEGYHRIYIKSDCGLKDTLVDFTCFDIPFPDNIDSANCTFLSMATDWSIGQPVISNVGNVVIVSTPMIGDVDGDGQQEIVIPSSNSTVASSLLLFNADGTLKSQFNITGTYIWNSVGIARVKWQNNTFKTIIVVLGTNKYLYAYDANGSLLWQSNQPFSSHYGEEYLVSAISFADFNHDGWTEVYTGSEIFDAATGVLLCKTNGNKGCANRTWSWSNTPYQTMAADLDGDSRLELAIGNTVYSVDIQSRTDFSANHITIASQLSTSAMTMEDGSPIPFTDGNTYLADINLDGSLDVIVMNEDESNRIIYIYVWNATTHSIICSKKIINARKFGTPQIGDLDNNGYPEICFITGTYSDHGTGDNDNIYALKYNPSNNNGAMDVFWSIPHEDNSGSTGLTMFDFNQDGYVELIYRDCNNLRIINGSLYNHQTGQPVSQPYDLANIPCYSATGLEYPVVADVDLDGEVEIIVGGETYSTDYGHIYIFKSGGIPWAPARKVWNQYMYNITNVNQDLTIPQYLFNNATPFTDPQNVVRRPFNNFLQQATTIDQYGRPFYAVPDAEVLSANITISGTNTTLNVTYTNQGDNTLNAPYHITVFANQPGGTVVQTFTVNTSLPIGGTIQQSLTLPVSTLCQIEGLNRLVVAINCDGGGIAQNGSQQPECDVTNNTTQVIINLQTDPTYISETTCDEFVWNGSVYSQSGQYQQTFSNPYGCDSLVILNLTVNHSDTVNCTVTACENYTWNGEIYTQSGNYTHITTNESGCERLEILALTISDNYREVGEVSECDSYYWPKNQQWYYQSTLDSLVVQGNLGECDSTFVLDLTIRHGDTVNYTVTACESYAWNGQTYTETGSYTHITTDDFGCDRMEILELVINHGSEYEFNVTSCESYEWYGIVYDAPGIYTHTLAGPHNCDSVLIMHLNIGEVFVMEENIESCNSYEWQGTTYSQGGDYQHGIENADGCDSIFILHLTINETVYHEIEHETCSPYTWNGITYDEEGIYEQTFISSTGCDSVVSLHLVMGAAMERPIHGVGSIYPSTDMVVGVYTYYIDSTDINPSNVHWSVDREDWLLFPHGAKCNLVCTSTGRAELRAWTESELCNIDATMQLDATFFGVDEEGMSLRVYPNPTKGKITIEWEEIQIVNVYDLLGQKLMGCEFDRENACILDLSRFQGSVYMLEVVSSTGRMIRPIVLTQ